MGTKKHSFHLKYFLLLLYIQAAEGGLTELQNLAQWCCVNPGVEEPDECPLRRKEDRCFVDR